MKNQNKPDEKIIRLISDLHSGEKEKRKKASDEILSILDFWIIRIAAEKFPSFIEKCGDDLIQEGRVAVLLHMMEYDPQKASPANFFYIHIFHAMNEYVQKNIFGVSRYYADSMNTVKKTEERLASKDGKSVHTIEEISSESGLSVKTVQTVERIRRNTSFISPKECLSLSDIEQDPVGIIEKREIQMSIEEAVGQLSINEKTAISLYYGVCGYDKMDIFGVMAEMKLPMEECQRLIYAAKRHLKKNKRLTNLT